MSAVPVKYLCVWTNCNSFIFNFEYTLDRLSPPFHLNLGVNAVLTPGQAVRRKIEFLLLQRHPRLCSLTR